MILFLNISAARQHGELNFLFHAIHLFSVWLVTFPNMYDDTNKRYISLSLLSQLWPYFWTATCVGY